MDICCSCFAMSMYYMCMYVCEWLWRCLLGQQYLLTKTMTTFPPIFTSRKKKDLRCLIFPFISFSYFFLFFGRFESKKAAIFKSVLVFFPTVQHFNNKMLLSLPSRFPFFLFFLYRTFKMNKSAGKLKRSKKKMKE